MKVTINEIYCVHEDDEEDSAEQSEWEFIDKVEGQEWHGRCYKEVSYILKHKLFKDYYAFCIEEVIGDGHAWWTGNTSIEGIRVRPREEIITKTYWDEVE